MELALIKKIGRESKDYLAITLGLILYSLGWAMFLLPYQITTGGVTGISAIIYYATGVEIQVSYFFINAIFLGFALKILGPKFSVKTIYAIFMLTFLLWFFQWILKDENGNLPQLLGPGQDFMACVIGAGMLGFGIGIVFCNNGSTGGTDIIAWIINKYKDVTLGRMMMYCDIVIISSCYFIFHDWRRVLFGFCLCVVYYEHRHRLRNQQRTPVGTISYFFERIRKDSRRHLHQDRPWRYLTQRPRLVQQTRHQSSCSLG